jgi:ethanolamine ammonia-lyase large subunit
MITKIPLFGTTYQFKDLKEIFAKANEEKSGDQLAGIAAQNAKERMAAKLVLADLTLADIRNHPLLSAEADEVSRLIEEQVDEIAYSSVKNWTVAELREYLLMPQTTSEAIHRISRGLTSEMIAAVAKLMSNMDLTANR